MGDYGVSLRMRRELATTPAWVLSRGIEMVKTENRKPVCGVSMNFVAQKDNDY